MNACYFCTNPPYLGCSCINFPLCAKHHQSKFIRLKVTQNIKGFIDIFSFIKWFKYDFTDSVKYRKKAYEIQFRIISELIIKSESFPIFSSRHTIRSIAFAQSSKIIATLDEMNEITIWKLSESAKLIEIKKYKISETIANTLQKSNLSLSEKHRFVAFQSGINNGIWYFDKGQKSVKLIENSYHCKIKLSQNEDLIVIEQPNKIRTYSAQTLEPLREININTIESFIEISEDQLYFCSIYYEKILQVFDLKNENFTHQVTLENSQTTCFILSKNNSYIATAHKNKRIVVYSMPELTDSFILESHESQIDSLAFNSDFSMLYSAGLDYYLIVWDLLNRRQFKKINLQVGCFFITIIEDNYLLTLGYDNDIKRLNIEDDYSESLLESHHDNIVSMAFSKSLKYFATGGHDHRIFICNTQDFTFISKNNAHEGCVTCLCFTKNEEILFSQGGDCKIKMWNRKTVELMKCFECEKYIDQIFVHENLLFLNNEDTNLQIMNLQNGKKYHLSSKEHDEAIYLVTSNNKFMVLIKKYLFIIWKIAIVN